jgi:hypothetical protein
VIGDRAFEALEPEQRELIQDPALVGDPLGQHHVEGGEAIRGDDQEFGAEIVDIAYLAPTKEGKIERCRGEGFSHPADLSAPRGPRP